jgi:hypothetical protein
MASPFALSAVASVQSRALQPLAIAGSAAWSPSMAERASGSSACRAHQTHWSDEVKFDLGKFEERDNSGSQPTRLTSSLGLALCAGRSARMRPATARTLRGAARQSASTDRPISPTQIQNANA